MHRRKPEGVIESQKNLPIEDVILKAAEDLFVSRGFEETKISDISSAAGICINTIYGHFKNKQEILFRVTLDRSQDKLHITRQYLKGLVGAKTKLRQLVWYYLEFLTINKSYSYILLFGLRPNREYYAHRNVPMQEFVEFFKDAITEGQNTNEIRSDVSAAYLMKLIFGAVDLMIIMWLLKNQPKPTDLIDPFWDLLINAIAVRQSPPEQTDKRKVILAAATSIFARDGYRKARIHDIAKLAGVAEGTIYQLFRNKEDMLFSLPQEKNEELTRNLDNRLRMLIADYLAFLDDNEDYSSIQLFDLRYNRNFYSDPAYELFQNYTHRYIEVIQEGIRRKHYRESVDPAVAIHMIFGMIDHSLLTCLLFKKPGKMAEVYNPLCKLVFDALQREEHHAPSLTSSTSLLSLS